jgi:prevent-host-death family protein
MRVCRVRSRRVFGQAQNTDGAGLPLPEVDHFVRLGCMEDQVYNIAEAKMHLSKLIERVERGERITIARNNRPVAVVSPAVTAPQDVLARIDGVRERIRERNGGRAVLQRGETWHDLVEEGRRV